MSKITRKCPNCGATMPADVKYCRKCHAKLDSGRVENLSQPAQQSAKSRRDRDDDSLRNLPKPVRPAEEGPAPEDSERGFFNPATAGEKPRKKPFRRSQEPMDGEVPQPVSTARGVDMDPNGYYDEPERGGRNLWPIIAVLAIIFVIIIVAILLVVRLNRAPSGEQAQTSQPFGSPNVITTSTDEPSPTPSASPTPTPTATPTPSANVIVPPAQASTPTPVPTVTPVPGATPTATPGYTVTAMNDTVYINGVSVNIRSGPGTSYSAIGSESTGYELQRTGRANNGWSRVNYKGSVAYVSESYLTGTKPAASNTNTNTNTGTTSSDKVRVNAASGANLRTGPGTGYSIAASVANNTELTKTGTSGDWTIISYNGQTLYISTALVTGSSSSGTTSGTTTSTGVTPDSGTVTVTGNSVRIRTGPGTGYGQIGSVNYGTTLTVTGKSGDWYQVSYNGQTGYISASYAKKQ